MTCASFSIIQIAKIKKMITGMIFALQACISLFSDSRQTSFSSRQHSHSWQQPSLAELQKVVS